MAGLHQSGDQSEQQGMVEAVAEVLHEWFGYKQAAALAEKIVDHLGLTVETRAVYADTVGRTTADGLADQRRLVSKWEEVQS